MGKSRKYQQLVVWQRAMNLVVRIYRLAGTLPDTEKFGLCSQMQRAAISIPSNIAEGAGRSSKKEFVQYLAIARGSLFELETQLMLVKRLGMSAEQTEIQDDIEAVFAMLTQLTRRLRANN